MAQPQSVSGFAVVPIQFNGKSKAGHLLYYREHRVREEDASKPLNRTLFVLNVPPYCNQECLLRLFGPCGRIDSVILQDKPTAASPEGKTPKTFPTSDSLKGFQYAYVVFQKSSSIPRAMQLSTKLKEPFLLSTKESQLSTGYAKWCAAYAASRPDAEDLQKSIDEFMLEHDARINKEEEEAKEQEGVPDEEGWITVTRKSAKPAVARTERNQKRLRAKERKKREKTELMNFYTFQMRETKREHIAELRKKFEEDKAKIVEMKAARRFKPY